MINAINTQTQSCFGMPTGRVTTAWTPALPMHTGAFAALATGADVQGTVVSKRRYAADFGTLPGTSVWSPPT